MLPSPCGASGWIRERVRPARSRRSSILRGSHLFLHAQIMLHGLCSDGRCRMCRGGAGSSATVLVYSAALLLRIDSDLHLDREQDRRAAETTLAARYALGTLLLVPMSGGFTALRAAGPPRRAVVIWAACFRPSSGTSASRRCDSFRSRR